MDAEGSFPEICREMRQTKAGRRADNEELCGLMRLLEETEDQQRVVIRMLLHHTRIYSLCLLHIQSPTTPLYGRHCDSSSCSSTAHFHFRCDRLGWHVRTLPSLCLRLQNYSLLVSKLHDKPQSHEDNKPHTGGVILLVKAYEENCQGSMSVQRSRYYPTFT
jgi:hypothetical protein